MFAFQALLFFTERLEACALVGGLFHRLNLNLHGREKSRPQIGESGAHPCTTGALEQVTMGEDDTVEIPAQDGFDRVTGGAAVGNHASDQPMRTQPSSGAAGWAVTLR